MITTTYHNAYFTIIINKYNYDNITSVIHWGYYWGSWLGDFDKREIGRKWEEGDAERKKKKVKNK